MGYTKEEKAEIWLDSFGEEYSKNYKLHKLAPSAYALAVHFSQWYSEVEKIVGAEQTKRMNDSLQSGEYMHKLLEGYAQKRIQCVPYNSSLYPELLRQISDLPFVLYCRGNTELLKERKFAIVGARRTLPQIMKKTEEFSRAISKKFTVVTGLADGGDSAVLNGALPGGNVISVLAYGFDYVYPECNRHLLEETEKNGLVVTEYIPSEKPVGFHFPARNRIIAGLSEGVLVVSAGEKSGTRITAEHAYSYGRDVFAFPYTPGVVSGVGCNALIKEYAALTDNLVDIGKSFGINLNETEEISLTGAEQAVYLILKDEEEAHISLIAEKSGLKAHELPPVLMMLEMKKLIVSCGGNRYAAVR